VEARDPRQADALPQATAASDASVFAHPDAAADAAHRERHRSSADGAEKLAARARDARVSDAKRRRSALLAAQAAEPLAAELCTRAAARSAERSSAAVAAQIGEQPAAPQWEPLAEHSLKSVAEPLRLEHVPLAVVSLGVRAARPLAPIPSEAQRPARGQLESRVVQPPKVPEP